MSVKFFAFPIAGLACLIALSLLLATTPHATADDTYIGTPRPSLGVGGPSPVPTPADPTPPPTETPSPPPSDTSTPQDNVVYSWQELVAWAAQTEEEEVRVSLGCDIAVDAPLAWHGDGVLQIDAGPYQISLTTIGTASIRGRVVFIGTPSTGNALFYVADKNLLLLDTTVKIHVSGSGAIGVWTDWPNGLQSNFARIYAEGEGAAAVYAAGDIKLAMADLHAAGENSCALVSFGDTDVIYSSLVADGPGSQAVRSAGSLLLDSAYTVPAPESAELVTRTAVPTEFFGTRSRFYFGLGEEIELPKQTNFALQAEGRTSVVVSAALDWEPLTPSGDFETLVCSASISPPLPQIGLIGLDRLTERVYIVDRALPHIVTYTRLLNKLELLDPLPANAEVVLFASTDGGESWSEISYTTAQAFIRPDVSPVPGVTTWYQLLVTTAEQTAYSNILSVTVSEDGALSDDLGGERIASDLDEDASQPPPIGNPAPTPSPEEPYVPDTSPDDTETDDNALPSTTPEIVPPIPTPKLTLPPVPEPPLSTAPVIAVTTPTAGPSAPPVPNPTPSSAQPAPEPATSASAGQYIPTSPTDRVNDSLDGTTFSGKQLSQMAQTHPGGLSFFAGRAQMLLPVQDISGWDLAADERVSISVQEAPENTWTVVLSHDGAALAADGLTLLFQLLEQDTGSYYCLDGDGMRYDGGIADGQLSVPIPGGGVYTLYVELPASTPEPPPPAPAVQPSEPSEEDLSSFVLSPWLIFIGAAVLALMAGLIAFTARKRR